MIVLPILIVLLIAAIIYFLDDIPKWIENAKKFWNEIPTLFDRNIRTKPKVKRNVTQEEIQRERLKIQMQQMAEAKKGFQKIRDSCKPQGYARSPSFEENFSKFESQTKSKSKSIKGNQVTDWERRYLWDGISIHKRVPCINCEVDDMYKGETNGPVQQWRCPHCGQGIELTFYSNTVGGFQCKNLGIYTPWKRN
jgi:hypothetical protein